MDKFSQSIHLQPGPHNLECFKQLQILVLQPDLQLQPFDKNDTFALTLEKFSAESQSQAKLPSSCTIQPYILRGGIVTYW